MRHPIVATILVLLGVSGCGKTSVGRALAAAIGGDFFDADEFHPAANVEKMRRGEPLSDQDRQPWLAAIAEGIEKSLAADRSAVFTCSGLKPEYRRILQVDPAVRLVMLECSREELARRLAARKGHFFPASLLDSQLSTLVPPSPDEHVLIVHGDGPLDQVVETIRQSLDTAPS